MFVGNEKKKIEWSRSVYKKAGKSSYFFLSYICVILFYFPSLLLSVADTIHYEPDPSWTQPNLKSLK